MSDLVVEGLNVAYGRQGEFLPVVRDVSLHVRAGEAMGVVGESGSGKSTLAMAVAGLLQPREARVTADRIALGNDSLKAMTDKTRRRVLGRRIGFIFQNPHVALNPVLTIERQMTDHLRWHLGMSARAARDRAAELLEEVAIADPSRCLRGHPHEFSGGMLQRVTIAMALACEPELVIADEPTTALDASVQSDIVDLMAEIRKRRALSLIWITHDLALLRRVVDRVSVMYAGRIVEVADVAALYGAPRHPYTAALIASIDSMWSDEGRHFNAIEGTPPAVGFREVECAFRTRCSRAFERCSAVPPLLSAGPSAAVACWAADRGGIDAAA